MEKIRAATAGIHDLSKAELLRGTLASGETGYHDALSRMFQVNISPGTLHGRFEGAQVTAIQEAIHDLCRRLTSVVIYLPELNAHMTELEEADKKADTDRSPLGLSMTVAYMCNDIGNTVMARIRAIFDNFADHFSDDEITQNIMERIKSDFPINEEAQNALLLELRSYIPEVIIQRLRDYFTTRIANAYVGQLKLLDAMQIACAKVSDRSQPKETIGAAYVDKSNECKAVLMHCNPESGRIALTDAANTSPGQIVKPPLVNCIKIEIPLLSAA